VRRHQDVALHMRQSESQKFTNAFNFDTVKSPNNKLAVSKF